jgi:RNA polymerase sigma factor (sigma-70 family)
MPGRVMSHDRPAVLYMPLPTREGSQGAAASEISEQTKLALFEQIIVPHLAAAYNLAVWLTRNSHDAEDVVQEAYLRAFRFFDGFHGDDGKAWLLAVVRNTCHTWLRREKGSQTMVMFDEQMHCSDLDKMNPEDMLLEKVNAGSLRECLNALPLEYREVMILREMEEMSYRDIAHLINIPIGTVMSRLSRARRRLEACIAARVAGGLA